MADKSNSEGDGSFWFSEPDDFGKCAKCGRSMIVKYGVKTYCADCLIKKKLEVRNSKYINLNCKYDLS